jgi:hypothetical protein
LLVKAFDLGKQISKILTHDMSPCLFIDK